MTDREPGHDAGAMASRAMSLHQQGQFELAEEGYRAALGLAPDNPDVLHRLGLLLFQTGRLEEAEKLIGRALEIDAGAAQTWYLLGLVRARRGESGEALQCCTRALAIQPDNPAALNLAGNLESARGNHPAARELLERALHFRPDFADAQHNLGIALVGLGDWDGALRHYAEAIRLNPKAPQAHVNHGLLLLRLGRFEEARDAFAAALARRPAHLQARLEHLYAKLFLCDWDGLDEDISELSDVIEEMLKSPAARAPSPYVLNLVPLPEELVRRTTRRYAQQLIDGTRKMIRVNAPAPAPDERLHIAYVSPDLGAHAVGTLVYRLFEHHDRERFHVSAFSLRSFDDYFSQQIRAGCDAFYDLSAQSLQGAADCIAETQPHILIDLGGYTEGARPELLAARLAPLQLSWLGYLNSSGASFVDYLLADSEVIPAAEEDRYCEAIARLPKSFLPCSPLPVAAHRPGRAELGLPEQGIVFCSFNNTYKIQHDTFTAWMNILHRVPDSVLWIYAGVGASARDNLLRHAAAHGIEKKRLVFADSRPMDAHMARLPCADLFLDTFHYNAGSTAVSALAAGVPILTLRGQRMLGRMGASLNRAAGLPQLVCESPETYTDAAVQFALQPERLRAVHQHLARVLKDDEVFSIGAFTAHLESVLNNMWEGYAAGDMPRSFQA